MSSSDGPLITEPGIEIDERGQWIFQNQPIDNPSVLNYFKTQLFRHADGRYYIENVFGARKEHGYLKRVAGFPLRAVRITPLAKDADSENSSVTQIEIQLETGESCVVPIDNLRIFASDTLAVILPSGVPARLSALAMASLVEYLDMDAGENFFLRVSGERIALSGADFATWFDS
ncbi:MAG: hypothetical protein KDK34_16330 [Leptospiraceae bacterium]|nr:hypothetical protein [Leptospiraceae bacterium]MCB1321826.1 hypothetical protein [Leptospiraceae bacterium]